MKRLFIICIFLLLLAACTKKAEVAQQEQSGIEQSVTEQVELPDVEQIEDLEEEIILEDYNASELDDLSEGS